MKKSTPLTWLWLVALVIAPLSYVSLMAFLTRSPSTGASLPFSLESWQGIFDPQLAPLLALSFFRSAVMALLTTLFCILLGYPLALFLVLKAGRARSFLFFLLLLPFWTNFLIRIYAWYALLSDSGWINQALAFFGLEPLNMLFTPQAVLIGMVYNYLPFMTMSLYVSLEKLDPLLIEAAADLGATRWLKFWTVIRPLSLPGLIAGSVMVFIPSFGEFVIPDVLGGGTSLYVGNLLAQQFLVARNWPLGAALSLIVMFFIFALLWVMEKATKGQLKDEMIL